MAALACAYAGDLDRARTLNERWLAEATSPSRLAWATYYQAEIENLASRHDLAEQRYLEAITLGRNAGDTFVIGVATIGLFTLRAIEGREHEALAGYRRSDRAVRANRILDPPVDRIAQPRNPAATPW